MKENGQSGDKRGSNRALLPWFNLYTPCILPLTPAFTQALFLPETTSLFCSAASPHVTGVQTASGAAWHYQAFVGVCGRGQCAGVAEWPCGGSSPFFLNQ